MKPSTLRHSMAVFCIAAGLLALGTGGLPLLIGGGCTLALGFSIALVAS